MQYGQVHCHAAHCYMNHTLWIGQMHQKESPKKFTEDKCSISQHHRIHWYRWVPRNSPSRASMYYKVFNLQKIILGSFGSSLKHELTVISEKEETVKGQNLAPFPQQPRKSLVENYINNCILEKGALGIPQKIWCYYFLHNVAPRSWISVYMGQHCFSLLCLLLQHEINRKMEDKISLCHCSNMWGRLWYT